MMLILSCAKPTIRIDPLEPAIPPHDAAEIEEPLSEAVTEDFQEKDLLPIQREMPASIALGVILPLSGPFREFGEKVLESILLAMDFWNSQKVVPYTLFIEDCGTQPEKARQAVFGMAEDPDLRAIIGPLSSEESLAAAKEAQRKGIPLITLTRNEEVTQTGDYIFCAYPSLYRHLQYLSDYAVNTKGLRRIAVLFPDVQQGRQAAEFFQVETIKNGGDVTHFLPYQPDQTDYSREIEHLAGRKPAEIGATGDGRKRTGRTAFDALFIPDTAQRVSMIASQLAFYDVAGFQLLGHSGLHVPEVLMGFRDLYEGAVLVEGFFAHGKRQESNDFSDLFYAAYGREPDTLEASAYDATLIALQIAERTKKERNKREAFRNALSNLAQVKGTRGSIKVSDRRLFETEPVLVTIREGYLLQIMRH